MKVRYEYIENLANQLLAKTTGSSPVDIQKIIKKLGIRIVEQPLGPTSSGAAIIEGSERTILINEQESSSRKRFTLAHELGHILLHKEERLNIDDRPIRYIHFRDDLAREGTNWKEIEANFFAASILMPAQYIIDLLEKEDVQFYFEEDKVEILAKKFGVSPSAMAIRLGYLGVV